VGHNTPQLQPHDQIYLSLANYTAPYTNKMSSNVGLTTPRGSGTSGYVQRNLAHLKPRDQGKPYSTDFDSLKHRQRQPDKEILEHDRKREVELKVFELRDRLEDEGFVLFPSFRLPRLTMIFRVDEEEIETQTEALRRKLVKEMEKGGGSDRNGKGLKMHQVHELAEAKIKQDDRFRNALGISRNYEEGSHWKKQEERKKALEAEADGSDVAEAEKERINKAAEEHW
jgi:hypothetical protein